MDRQRRRPGRLTLAAAGALAGAMALAAPAATPLKAMKWLAPGADAPTLMTRRPAECLARPADAEARYRVEVGRAAFRTPLILGGVAARAGLECATCHAGGRRNADFDFPGISGAPGTADVRSFLFSPKRGDNRHIPRIIPDLAAPKTTLKINQEPSSGALEGFIHGLVVEEFDGAEPPPTVLSGLAAYVRALSPEACPSPATEAVTAAADLSDASRAVRAALGALARHDARTAVVMIGAGRSALGSLAERYGAPGLAADVEALRVSDLALAATAVDVRRGQARAGQGLDAWLAALPALRMRLAADEGRSFYSRAVLAEAVGK